jgi:hypothetical protein
MPETGSKGNAIFGHATLSNSEVSRTLYLIAAGFYASGSLHGMKSGLDFDPIAILLDDNEREFLQERLIYAAIRLRIIDDLHRAEDAVYRDDSKGWIVGWIKMTGRKPAPLRMRDALNNIIHATRFNWCQAKDLEAPNGPLKPQVFLYGRDPRERKAWKCCIEISEFVGHGCRML